MKPALNNHCQVTTVTIDRLCKVANETTKASSERFFKEDVTILGCKSARVKEVAKLIWQEFNLSKKPKQGIFSICENLLKTGLYEPMMVGVVFAQKMRRHFETADMLIFEDWIEKYVSNWAVCDTFCTHSIGDLITKFPELISFLIKWTRSENMWVRRASAVSLIAPAKRGDFLNEVFQIADILLVDDKDMVQKGYGWMLKVAANKHTEDVFEFVIKRRATMPRTALRYAIEKMPKELKTIAIQR